MPLHQSTVISFSFHKGIKFIENSLVYFFALKKLSFVKIFRLALFIKIVIW